MSARVLVVAEHDGETLSPSTAKTVNCAALLPAPEITVVVFADAAAAAGIHRVAEAAAVLAGVDRVRIATDPAFARPTAAAIAPALARLAEGFSHVLGPSNTFGKDLMPRTAALLGVGHVSDVMAVESATRFRRPIYAGNAIATVEALTRPVVATVRVSSFAEAATATAAAPIETLAIEAAADKPASAAAAGTRLVSLSGAKKDRPDLQSARRVVTGGRGMGSAEGFSRLERLADILGAAIGATRAAVDAGFAPNELQVGQTGKVIAPELYIALGVSGAIQHLAGIKDAGTVVAINRDAEAPIFDFADIGLVGDIDTILPELEALLGAGSGDPPRG